VPRAVLSNAGSPLSRILKDSLPWSDFPTADFRSVYPTCSVCVVYSGRIGLYLLVDEEGRKTGRQSLVQFRQERTIEDMVQAFHFNIRWLYISASLTNCLYSWSQHGPSHIRHPFPGSSPRQFSYDINLLDRDQGKEDIGLYPSGLCSS
jgi:hypothetical protein